MEYWQYHNSKMLELKKIYNRISKQTQNKLQDIFDSFNIDFEHLYNIADNKTKKKINTYIEEWKDKGLLIGYFGMLANSIYKRIRVKNSEILELLIYGAYIEEQNKLDEYENKVMYDDINYYYQEGQKEVNKTIRKKKPISIIDMALFLYLLEQANLQQYIQMTIQYNAQQIYKQTIINVQQQKELEIENNEFQNILNRQQNTKLCINNNKISGFMDTQIIGLNNQAKLEGIKEVDNNVDAKVKFVSIIDGKETDMCNSLNGQEFYINKENIFYRYYGETQKELRMQKIKCKGLVLGLNLPPITHHFHYCRSYIIYLPNFKNNDIKEDIQEFLREKIVKIYEGITEDLKNIMNDYTKIPTNVLKRLFEDEKIKVVLGDDTNVSYWDKDKKEIVLAPNIEKGEFAHEIGHALFDTLNVKEYDSYKELAKYIMKNGKLKRDTRSNVEYLYVDTKMDLVSEYQTYLGRIKDIEICSENIENGYFRELLSEAYRGIAINKKQDKRIIKLIEEVNKNA